jgi:catechol 2,3-dioxygenase-like lactoylglutathione lyase family enzyme
MEGVGVAGVYVRDQDEALDFYVGKVGFTVHTDVRNGDYRWLTVQHPDQPSFQLGLFVPQPPTVDEGTAQMVREIVAKGAMPPLVLTVEDCRSAYDRMSAAGVEFTQEPIERFGSVDASFRDPSGNGWKMVQARS